MNSKQNEIKYISHLNAKEKKWVQTKPFGNFNFQESALRLRDFSYIIELLKLDEEKKFSLLDLGCGSGWTSIMLAKLGLEVTGTDIAPEMIKIAKENAKKENLKINFLVLDSEKINFKEKFDRVLSYDTLHHVPNDQRVLKNAYRGLKKGGLILIVEPSYKHGVDKEAQAIAARFGVLEKGFLPSYLTKEMQKIGFKKIVRFHCGYEENKPGREGFGAFLKEFSRRLYARLILSRRATQVWIRAEK